MSEQTELTPAELEVSTQKQKDARIIGMAIYITLAALVFVAGSLTALWYLEPAVEYDVVQGKLVTVTPHEAFYSQVRLLLSRGTSMAYALLVVLWSLIAFWKATAIKLWDVPDAIAKAIILAALLYLLAGMWTG